MSKMVLARKWRPHNLQTLVGHESVVRALTHAFTEQRLHQAYLFTGTRGVGKTTLARIMASCLNCEIGITATPCETCDICRNIRQNTFSDLIEIDAASRTKVEDTRDLLDGIPYAPQYGRYKVYLIDEVHMLSTHSFNALLKTLEEPPEHVIFILATTDPEKLPATILSRCLHFHLKPLTHQQISQQLNNILEQENIRFEQPALDRIAIAADGSLRDALSLVEQAIGIGGGTVDQAATQLLLNDVGSETIHALLNALQHDDHTTLLKLIDTISEQGIDFTTVITALLEAFQKIALLQIVQDHHEPEDIYKTLAQHWSAESVQLYYQILLLGRKDLSLAPNAKSGFTMIMLRLLAFTPNPKKTAPIKTTPTLRTIETKKETPKKNITPSVKLVAIHPTDTKPKPAENINSTPSLDLLTHAIGNSANWLSLIKTLPLDGLLQTILQQCAIKSYVHPQLMLSIDPRQAALLDAKNLARCENVFQDYFKQAINIQIEKGESNLVTPALQERQQQLDQKNKANQILQQDPLVQSLQKRFSATIIPESVQSLSEK